MPQVDLNWDAFCALPESVKTEYAGKSVLLHDGEVDSYRPDRAPRWRTGSLGSVPGTSLWRPSTPSPLTSAFTPIWHVSMQPMGRMAVSN